MNRPTIKKILNDSALSESEKIDQIFAVYTASTSKLKTEEDVKKAVDEALKAQADTDGDYKSKFDAEVIAHTATKVTAKKALEDEKAAHAAFKTSVETEKITSAKHSAVLKQLIADGANEKFAKVVAKSFDLEKLELDGDAIKDWETVSKPHKAEFAEVFQTADVKGVDTANPPKGGTGEPDPFLAGFDS